MSSSDSVLGNNSSGRVDRSLGHRRVKLDGVPVGQCEWQVPIEA